MQLLGETSPLSSLSIGCYCL